jgi:hypothetical protein
MGKYNRRECCRKKQMAPLPPTSNNEKMTPELERKDNRRQYGGKKKLAQLPPTSKRAGHAAKSSSPRIPFCRHDL